MNKRFAGVLVFAFVVASVASLLLYRLLVKRAEPTQAAAPVTTQIVVATKDLEVGSVIKPDDVKLADWTGPVPTGAILHLDGKDGAVNRGVNTAIVAKEPVLASRLALDGAGGGLAGKIPPGMRAVAIRVNEVNSVSGFVSTGTHVDVMISGTRPNGNANLGAIAKTVQTLEDLEVLSAGQELKKDAENKPVLVQTVNLLVTPEQAEQLSLASNMNIQLVLRNPIDRAIAKTSGASTKNLFDGGRADIRQAGGGTDSDGSGAPQRAPKPAAPARRVYTAAAQEPPAAKKQPDPPVTLEIVSGTKKTEVKFSGEGK
jgi:pilus assembly protein CpaB